MKQRTREFIFLELIDFNLVGKYNSVTEPALELFHVRSIYILN